MIVQSTAAVLTVALVHTVVASTALPPVQQHRPAMPRSAAIWTPGVLAGTARHGRLARARRRWRRSS